MHKDKPCIVIAEAGVNHNGNLKIAQQLIECAAEAKADYIKFQTFTSETLVTKDAKLANYQSKNLNRKINQHEMLKSLELSHSDHGKLINYCGDCGIKFLSTGFDVSDLEFLLPLNLDFLKIPSGDLTNYFLLEKAGSSGKDIILSTGMAELDEISEALTVIKNNSIRHNMNITLLHCTTDYPAQLEEINLNAMLTLKEKFGLSVGYSDHSLGIAVPIAAVALGASVIEKHFTLDRKMEGPDHKASLEPNELQEMVRCIRDVECALGSFNKQPTAGELENKAVARKSLVASVNIKKGDVFSRDNIVAKRPGNGLSPMFFPDIEGRFAKKDYLKDEIIEI